MARSVRTPGSDTGRGMSRFCTMLLITAARVAGRTAADARNMPVVPVMPPPCIAA